ncbi:MAG: type II toxin-antitoxin system VapC family toxin [Deltaproteobacteria bacterium]|nr:type II toxin-antitoxin system VapC family toxin [Deltaproteobacteria bacterium]MBW1911294.1 type II toxin-antitoxin system VapC family toxin [Deltaproteobacteria bacterium]MBW2034948.1 type II toxin-antitoxin system VapC family toxin [Deltaproteobacteria bacterium]MBW2115325.1 type II toxin-antitoxin system VapC family toxin [Deltaproteobacteria bacterium]
MKLFIDTWGWLTLRDRKESLHQEVKDFYSRFRGKKGNIYTSDYVLDETITLLFRRLPFKMAKGSLATIDKAIKEGYLQIEWVTPERFERAKGLRLKYQDKPKISFTDLTSMVIMKELDLKEVMTGDEHFEQVGMGFQRKP